MECADERLRILLSPAAEGMKGGPLVKENSPLKIKLARLVDDRAFEPALFHNPYFILPAAGQYERYIQFLQALRHTDKLVLGGIGDPPQHPTCLIYPHRDYLMLVMIRAEGDLVEPPPADGTADAASLAGEDIFHLRRKLESLNQTDRARSADNGI